MNSKRLLNIFAVELKSVKYFENENNVTILIS